MKGETIRRPEVLDQVMTASLEISDVRPVAFDRFVDEAGLRLRRVLVAHYGVEIGVEVTADALAHAWEHWDRVRVMGNPTGYLYRVAQSSARRYRRWASPPSFPPERAGEALEGEPGLPAALARLPERQRIVVVLIHAHGWSYEETAEVLGVSHGTVRNQLHRGMKRLRRFLEVENDG